MGTQRQTRATQSINQILRQTTQAAAPAAAFPTMTPKQTNPVQTTAAPQTHPELRLPDPYGGPFPSKHKRHSFRVKFSPFMLLAAALALLALVTSLIHAIF